MIKRKSCIIDPYNKYDTRECGECETIFPWFKMIPLIERRRLAVEALCQKYRVTRLEVFGSAAGDSFDPEKSDVDFLVEFQVGANLGPWMANYFDLKEEL